MRRAACKIHHLLGRQTPLQNLGSPRAGGGRGGTRRGFTNRDCSLTTTDQKKTARHFRLYQIKPLSQKECTCIREYSCFDETLYFPHPIRKQRLPLLFFSTSPRCNFQHGALCENHQLPGWKIKARYHKSIQITEVCIIYGERETETKCVPYSVYNRDKVIHRHPR